MNRLFIALLAASLAGTASAQVLVDGRPVPDAATATASQLQALQAQIPQPASALPPTEGSAASMGAQTMRYALEDHVHQRITRSGTAVTDSAGGWAITWTMPLAATPTVYPIPVNAGQQPVVCNVTTRTTTGATGRCWLSRTLPAVLTLLTNLLNYDIFGATAPGITVQVLALPPTQ